MFPDPSSGNVTGFTPLGHLHEAQLQQMSQIAHFANLSHNFGWSGTMVNYASGGGYPQGGQGNPFGDMSEYCNMSGNPLGNLSWSSQGSMGGNQHHHGNMTGGQHDGKMPWPTLHDGSMIGNNMGNMMGGNSHVNATEAPYGKMNGSMHCIMAGSSHGNTMAGHTHGNMNGSPHGYMNGSPRGNMAISHNSVECRPGNLTGFGNPT